MNPWMIALCILYVISPIDFIPDVLFPVGFIDDLGVLGYMGYSMFQSKP